MIKVVDREGCATTYDADGMSNDIHGLYLTKMVDGTEKQVAMYHHAAWQSAAIVADS